MKETRMRVEDQPGPDLERKSKLFANAKSLGKILRRYPNVQSNSPELYILSYLENLGSRKI